ncbi:hypothetical protein GCM10018962_37570 [Dactylosporangium matsuzakiense]
MHGLGDRRQFPRRQPDDRDQARDAVGLVGRGAVGALLEQLPLLAAGAAEEVRRRIEREKRRAFGYRVDERLRPELPRLDIVIVEESDLDVVADAGVHANLAAEVVVETPYEQIVRTAGVAEEKVEHTASADILNPTPWKVSI